VRDRPVKDIEERTAISHDLTKIDLANPAGISLKGCWKKRRLEHIISGIPSKRVRKKADELREAIRNGLDPCPGSFDKDESGGYGLPQ
jgi:hypothetical protein